MNTQSTVKTDWKIWWSFINPPTTFEVVQLPMYSHVSPLYQVPWSSNRYLRMVAKKNISHYLCLPYPIHHFDTIALKTGLFQVYPINTPWFPTLFPIFDSSIPRYIQNSSHYFLLVQMSFHGLMYRSYPINIPSTSH